MVELPLVMILEFYFHERFSSYDSIFENQMICLNNMATFVVVATLLHCSFDCLMEQISPVIKSNSDQYGRLKLHELLTFLSSILLVTASIIRIIVNGTEKRTFSRASSDDMNATLTELFVLESNTHCKELRWDHISEFVATDWCFLVCTVLPMIWLPCWCFLDHSNRFLGMIIYQRSEKRNDQEIPLNVIRHNSTSEGAPTVI